MPRNGWPSDEDSKPGSNACRTVPCSGSRAPPGCTPAGRRSLHACGPSARAHCALSTQSGPSFALSRELAVFRGVFPRHPSPGSPAPSGLTEGSEALAWAPPPHAGISRGGASPSPPVTLHVRLRHACLAVRVLRCWHCYSLSGAVPGTARC